MEGDMEFSRTELAQHPPGQGSSDVSDLAYLELLPRSSSTASELRSRLISLLPDTDVLETEVFLLLFKEVYKHEVQVTLNKLLVAAFCSLWREPTFMSWHGKGARSLSHSATLWPLGELHFPHGSEAGSPNNEVSVPKTILIYNRDEHLIKGSTVVINWTWKLPVFIQLSINVLALKGTDS